MYDIATFLDKNYSYVIATPQGKFIFPLGYKVNPIGILSDEESIAIVHPIIKSSGWLTKYFIQTVCGISYLSVINHNLFDDSSRFPFVSEFFDTVKIEKVFTHNKDIFDQIQNRKRDMLSPDYLVGLLQVKVIRDLVKELLEDKGELVAYLLTEKGNPRIYQITSTNSCKSVFFMLQTDFPTNYFKKLSSIGSLVLTLQRDVFHKWKLLGIDTNVGIKDREDFFSIIMKQYKDVYGL